jgi:beta-galactosidase
VYSNAEQVELFLNGESLGVKQRDSQDFPCAGLRWEAEFTAGEYHLRAEAICNGEIVSDELQFTYQSDAWSEPTEIRVTTEAIEDGRVYVEVGAYDAKGIFCPDAARFVRFGIAGDGKLLDNLGTIRGSRQVQLASGRAGIYVNPTGGLPAGMTVTDFVSAGGPASSLASLPQGTRDVQRKFTSVVSAACEGMSTVTAVIEVVK